MTQARWFVSGAMAYSVRPSTLLTIYLKVESGYLVDEINGMEACVRATRSYHNVLNYAR